MITPSWGAGKGEGEEEGRVEKDGKKEKEADGREGEGLEGKKFRQAAAVGSERPRPHLLSLLLQVRVA